MKTLRLATKEETQSIFDKFNKWKEESPSWELAIKGDNNGHARITICEFIANQDGLTLYPHVEKEQIYMMFRRYWINQPSALQPDHKYHGLLVIGPSNDVVKEVIVDVYPTSGEMSSMRVFSASLSPGWPIHLVKSHISYDQKTECLSAIDFWRRKLS